MFGQVIQFLMEHADLIDLIMEALSKGLTKQTLMDGIKTSMVEASNAQMKAEFPNG